MKKMFLAAVAALVLAGGITFMACNKEETISNGFGKNIMLKSGTINGCDVDVSDWIPAEEVGIIHNEMLARTIKHPDFFNPEKNDVILAMDLEYCKQKGVFLDMNLEEYKEMVNCNPEMDLMGLPEIATLLKNKYSLSEMFMNYITELNDCRNIENDQQYNTRLVELYDQIKGDANLFPFESYVLRGGISVAIESRKFWTNESQYFTLSKTGTKQQDEKPSTVNQLSCGEKVKVSWADVKGFFKGMFDGKNTHQGWDPPVISKNYSKRERINIIIEHEEQNPPKPENPRVGE